MALLQNYRLRPRVDDEHETIQGFLRKSLMMAGSLLIVTQ